MKIRAENIIIGILAAAIIGAVVSFLVLLAHMERDVGKVKATAPEVRQVADHLPGVGKTIKEFKK